jgi:hypothetical protein
MVSPKAMGALLWLEILGLTLPRRREMDFRRESKIYIENLAKFKEEKKIQNKKKWKKPENSLQNKLTRVFQYQV